MLLVGFSKEQGDAAEGWMHQMEPELLISHCTAATLDGTVEQAVTGAGKGQTSAEEHQHGNEVMPRLVLLSGTSGEGGFPRLHTTERMHQEAAVQAACRYGC